MSEANKAIVGKFLTALGSGDVATLKTLSTEDIVAVCPGTAAVCGTRNYEVIMNTAQAFPQITKSGGIKFRILNMIAEGDRVACQVDGFATLLNGKEYNNHYHNLFFLRDGKVCKMVEYLDLKLADEVLGPYLPPKS